MRQVTSVCTYSLQEIFQENSVYSFLEYEEDILNKYESLKLWPSSSTGTQFQNKQSPEANKINTILPKWLHHLKSRSEKYKY
jgi:hypothetical protein